MTAHFTLADDKQVFVARPPSYWKQCHPKSGCGSVQQLRRITTTDSIPYGELRSTSGWQCNKNAGKLVILPTFATNYGRQPHRD